MSVISANSTQMVVFESVIARQDGSPRMVLKEAEVNGVKTLVDIQYFTPDGSDVSDNPAQAYLDVSEQERSKMKFVSRADIAALNTPSTAVHGNNRC